MLIMSTFSQENFHEKPLIIILLRLRMSAYAYAYALAEHSNVLAVTPTAFTASLSLPRFSNSFRRKENFGKRIVCFAHFFRYRSHIEKKKKQFYDVNWRKINYNYPI